MILAICHTFWIDAAWIVCKKTVYSYNTGAFWYNKKRWYYLTYLPELTKPEDSKCPIYCCRNYCFLDIHRQDFWNILDKYYC